MEFEKNSFKIRYLRLSLIQLLDWKESGSGKSTTGRAIMGLVGHPGRVEADEMRLGDTDLLRLDERGFRRLRGKRVAMILQDPKYSLDHRRPAIHCTRRTTSCVNAMIWRAWHSKRPDRSAAEDSRIVFESER